MKKLFVFLMSLTLLFTTIPVYAEENAVAEDDITITTNQSYYVPKDENGKVIGETVYTLSALQRGYDQKIDLPIEHELVLTSKVTDLNNITAEMDTESDGGLGKKDIKLWFDERSDHEAKLEVNFANDKVTTTLNQDAGILIKKDGKVIKRLKFMYSTPALTDEHDAPKFHTLSAWSGKTRYDEETIEDYYKISNVVDVYAKNPKISYTYTAMGTYGLKNFLLNMDDSKTKSNDKFTFTNGKITIGAKNGNPKQKNTVTLVCKSAYLKFLKQELIKDFCKYNIATEDAIFDDIAVEYKNVAGKTYENGIQDNGQGCVIGGSMDPIYLAHSATVKPVGKVKIKSYKKTKTTIRLKWSKFSSSVSGYMIYRSTKKSSGYKKIKTVSSKKTSYTDKKLKKGKTYYYKIRPYRTITYTYTTKNKKKKKLSRKAYGSYSAVKKTKTSK